MTLKINRAPLLSIIKPCESFHHHMWIQIGVTVRKRLSWVLTSVILTFDLWPWTCAWTSLWSLVITQSWKFHDDTMMGTLSKRCHRQADRRTDRQTNLVILKAAWSQLKIYFPEIIHTARFFSFVVVKHLAILPAIDVIAPVPVKKPWRVWVNVIHESTMTNHRTSTK